MSHTFDLQKAARDAAGKYIRSHSAAVFQFTSADELYVGTAICVEIADRFFIASAADDFDVVKRGGKAITFPVKTLCLYDSSAVGSN